MQEQLWERGWDGHEQAQLRRWARLPFAEKLQWLEDAHYMVLALQKSREDQLESQRDARRQESAQAALQVLVED